MARFLALLGGFDGQFGQLFAVFDVGVEPQLQRRFDKAGDQAHGIAAVEFFLDLALELRVQHLGGEHKAGAGKHVVGHELDPLGQQAVQVDKVFDGLEQAVAQAAFVRATGHGGDQIDVAFAQHGALFGKGQAPRGAFALGEAVVLGIGKACAFEQGQQGVGGQGLFRIVFQAALVLPGLGVARFFHWPG